METFFETIDRYIAHQLSPAEEQVFLGKLKDDPQAAKEARAYLLARQSIQAAGKEAIRQQVALAISRRDQNRPARTIRHLPKWSYWAVAVAAAILILFWIRPVPQPTSVSVETFLALNLEADYGAAYRGVEGYETDSIWAEVQASLNAKKVEKAQAQLTLLAGHPGLRQQSKLSYIQGLTYIDQQNTDAALEFLSRVQSGSQYYPDAQWYSALLLMRNRQYNDARGILDFLDTLPQAFHYREQIKTARLIME